MLHTKQSSETFTPPGRTWLPSYVSVINISIKSFNLNNIIISIYLIICIIFLLPHCYPTRQPNMFNKNNNNLIWLSLFFNCNDLALIIIYFYYFEHISLLLLHYCHYYITERFWHIITLRVSPIITLMFLCSIIILL